MTIRQNSRVFCCRHSVFPSPSRVVCSWRMRPIGCSSADFDMWKWQRLRNPGKELALTSRMTATCLEIKCQGIVEVVSLCIVYFSTMQHLFNRHDYYVASTSSRLRLFTPINNRTQLKTLTHWHSLPLTGTAQQPCLGGSARYVLHIHRGVCCDEI